MFNKWINIIANPYVLHCDNRRRLCSPSSPSRRGKCGKCGNAKHARILKPQCLDFVDFSLILWGIRISNRITQRRQIVPRNRLGVVRYIRVKHKKGKSRRKGRFGMSKYMTKRYRNRKGGRGECFDPILCMFLLCSL